MAYVTGSVSSWTNLRTTLISELTTNHGWTLTGNVLHKGDVYVTLTVSAAETYTDGPGILPRAGNGVSAGELVDPCYAQPRMGRAHISTAEPTWPATFHLFVFDDPIEVYCILNFDSDKFLFMAFGKSSLSLPGSGVWLTASAHRGMATYTHAGGIGEVKIGPWFGGNINGWGGVWPSHAPFWLSQTGYTSAQNGSDPSFTQDTVHHNYDGLGWSKGQLYVSGYPGIAGGAILTQGAIIGQRYVAELINVQPSAWNQESTLIPIRAYAIRGSSKSSLCLELENARYMRVDNVEPGQIIEIGPDRWKTFPFYRKNAAARDACGTADYIAINHTGTYGWAIRYDGP